MIFLMTLCIILQKTEEFYGGPGSVYMYKYDGAGRRTQYDQRRQGPSGLHVCHGSEVIIYCGVYDIRDLLDSMFTTGLR